MADRKQLNVTTEKELRTYMHPLRQKILFELSIRPAGMTAKQLADTLGVAPSSTGHHLTELEKLGLVELDHTEVIHGFTARFYRAADVDVIVRPQAADRSIHQAMLENEMSQRVAHLSELGAWAQELGLPDSPLRSSMRSGVLYLTEAQAEELEASLAEKLEQYDRPAEGAHAYEFSFLTADLTLWQQLSDQKKP